MKLLRIQLRHKNTEAAESMYNNTMRSGRALMSIKYMRVTTSADELGVNFLMCQDEP